MKSKLAILRWCGFCCFFSLFTALLLVPCHDSFAGPYLPEGPGNDDPQVEQVTPTPTPTPTSTPTPTRTPIPTLTPTATPTPPPCGVYRIEVDVIYDADTHGQTLLTGVEGVPECAMLLVDQVTREILGDLNLMELYDLVFGKKLREGRLEDELTELYGEDWVEDREDEIEELSYLDTEIGRAFKRIIGDDTGYIKCNGTQVVRATRTEYLNNPDELRCDLSLEYLSSPVSLLWDGASTIDEPSTITGFRLNPYRGPAYYTWKASAKAPLLVYDPERSGEITSATQLFGDWTFGGQKVAMLGAEAGIAAPRPWQHGFEALASLDADQDGAVNGQELEPLALWFDENRDGRSDAGEVRDLRSEGVTALYYRVDRRDANGNLWVDAGYERSISGQTRRAPAVDWYGEGGNSPYELIAGLYAKAGQSEAPAGNDSKPADEPAVTAAAATRTLADLQTSLNGAWAWDVSGHGDGDFTPRGLLTFSDRNDGRLSGHAYLEVPSPQDPKTHFLAVLPLKGQKERLPDGTVRASFALKDFRGLTTTSTVTLVDPTTLQGESVAEKKARPGDGSKAFKYRWQARRQLPKARKP